MKRIYVGFVVLILVVLVVIIFLVNGGKQVPSPAKVILKPSSENKVKISVGAFPKIPFKLPDQFVIHTFANGLGHPRDLVFSPNGTLLVSDPSSGRVYALLDKNKDGVADGNKVVISGENRPHGLAFYNNKL